MTTTVLAPLLTPQFFTNAGLPLVGGQLFSYAAGTSTPLATYQDSTGLTPNANPVILNYRGEASIWIPPNQGYKFVLEDSAGNLIWTRDQVFQSQLLTLYGGVDSGIVNAYVINSASNFTAYTDGIFIIFIPSNTNTGPSTININGLGVINIVNGDASTFRAGEIVANIPAEILIKGGQAILVNAFPLQNLAVVQTFTQTLTGGTTSPAITFHYVVINNTVTVSFAGTNFISNNTSFGLNGWPIGLRGVSNDINTSLLWGEDNGVFAIAFIAIPSQIGGVPFISIGNASGNWTASGTKGLLGGSFSYILL